MDLSDLRKQYTKGELLEKEAPQNPFDLFGHWFDEVQKASIESEANALTLSTIDLMGSPKSRLGLKLLFLFYAERVKMGLFFSLITTVRRGSLLQNTTRFACLFFGLV